MKQSKQFINLLKWGSVEELENIAGSSDNKHPEPPYNFSEVFDIDQFETWYSTTIKWATEGTENFSDANILDFNTTIKFGNYFRKFSKERNEHLQKLVEEEDKCINYYRHLKIKCTEKELEKFENTRIYLYKIYIKAYNLMKMFDFIWSILYALNPYGMKYLLKQRKEASKTLVLLFSLQHVANQAKQVLNKPNKRQKTKTSFEANLNVQINNPSHLIISELKNFYINLCSQWLYGKQKRPHLRKTNVKLEDCKLENVKKRTNRKMSVYNLEVTVERNLLLIVGELLELEI
ncbi:unnamed protein product [Meloidogyne enterolobii]|uniref:Uncharacterized protein n=1 Tax=Meloidogyne enterolobii TaxID=390850 RepID=A0ACB0ZKI2_MELEN